MSQENVELILDALAAMNRSDTEAFLEAFHPDVVWEESGDVLPGLRGTYRGPAGVRKWFETAFLEVWESFNVEVTEVANVGDAQVFLGTLTIARGAGSGVETELRAWQVFWFADGKVARRQVFFTRPEALEAAGLSE